MNVIYLDHHSTTPLDQRVLDAMLPYLTEKFGNASSTDHIYGYDASDAVESSRKNVANAIGSKPDEIIFTSGATESNNIALLGTMEKYKDQGNHLITCYTEHKAVLDTAKYLEKIGKRVTYLPVDKNGHISLEDLISKIDDKTVMVSIMLANNEIGTIADVAKIGKITHDHNIIFHTDATQAVGHIPVNVQKMNIDLMSFSAHKMYGPKGIGALYIRGIKPRVKPLPLIHGGGQERNIRSGTLNVPCIVGFSKAIDIAIKEMYDEDKLFQKFSNTMLESFERIGGLLNGPKRNRLSHNLNICFPETESKAIINAVSREIAISAGSACTTQTVEPSHVLLALGYDESRAHSSIRIGIGRFNTKDEIDHATRIISGTVLDLMKITTSRI